MAGNTNNSSSIGFTLIELYICTTHVHQEYSNVDQEYRNVFLKETPNMTATHWMFNCTDVKGDRIHHLQGLRTALHVASSSGQSESVSSLLGHGADVTIGDKVWGQRELL